ncbi:PD-(D/E)XK nuclease family protein, partial [Sandarakinorhabdus sp.]|uniref:PD-(D/E)XK nuclease family protein n=1 Tax=Sandarakinorhabdus sp. TaxID=1916663 RepID=UPI00286EA202
LLLADGAVRVPGAGHHRLAILGPVEAQLARADVMILAGMNEGSWPARPAPDPWLAPAIRSALGLPGTARALGLAAQDFVRALGAPEVLLTRARRDASGPKIASRLWLRLDAYAGGLQGRDDLIALARALDRNNAAPIIPQRPAPAPPLALRPRQLSITDIDTLINDPFAFHAKAILRLRPLEALELDPTAAQRGQIIHGVMEAWIKQGHGTPDQLALIAAERLTTEAAHFPLLRALWLPRAQNAITWAGVQVLAREGEWPQMWAEAAGSLILSNGVTLRGRLDRVDISADGRLAITDYKTGKPPSAKRVRGLEANQLALGLAIAAAGRLATEKDALPKGRPDDMSYWQLGGGQDKPGEIFRVLFHGDKQQITAEELVDKALEVAVDRTSHFLLTTAPFLPKLRPAHAWGDYDHLARVAEWAGRPAANGAPS